MRVGRRFSSAVPSGLAWVAVVCAAAALTASTSAEDYVVSFPVTVTDASGRPVRGLAEQDFSITEDGQPRSIRTFADKDIPLSLAFIVDTSPPMRGPWMNDTFHAIHQLVREAVGFDDEVS